MQNPERQPERRSWGKTPARSSRREPEARAPKPCDAGFRENPFRLSAAAPGLSETLSGMERAEKLEYTNNVFLKITRKG